MKTYNNGKDLMPDDILVVKDKNGFRAWLGFVKFMPMSIEGGAMPDNKQMKLYTCFSDSKENAKKELLLMMSDVLKELANDSP